MPAPAWPQPAAERNSGGCPKELGAQHVGLLEEHGALHLSAAVIYGVQVRGYSPVPRERLWRDALHGVPWSFTDCLTLHQNQHVIRQNAHYKVGPEPRKPNSLCLLHGHPPAHLSPTHKSATTSDGHR
ncbi:unnamed protein product [Closterium sp. Yama58-4]|nr:unnamed protein product [Closterium sp. Yama58-4]